MPWTPADAHRHKRGLSARQARQWARVANSVQARCLADGGTQAACDASAIRQANGAVGDPELSIERRLCIATALTVPPARLTLNNREYLTAPAVLIVQGVLNGGYIDASELHPTDWNNVPIVMNHPTNAHGQPMSARTPEVLATSGVGYLYHARLGTGSRQGHTVSSLQAELWLDVAQVLSVGGEAVQAMTMLEAQSPLELSTGFYSYADETPGSFYGVSYREVHHEIRPDHLALLPNGVGACNWAEDGCGAPRLHEQCTCLKETRMEHLPARACPSVRAGGWRGFVSTLKTFVHHAEADLATNQTDADTREALYGALAREMGVDVTPVFIDSLDMEAQTFTYRQGERLLQRSWTETDGMVALTPDVQDVQRATTYTPVTQAQQEVPMATEAVKRRVSQLISNTRTAWQEDDRPQLEAMSEVQLQRLEPPVERGVAVADEGPATVDEAIATLPAHLRESVGQMAREHATRKQAAITALVQGKCVLSETHLQSLELLELEGLVHASRLSPTAYDGQGMPHLRLRDEDNQPPTPPNTFEAVVEYQKTHGLR